MSSLMISYHYCTLHVINFGSSLASGAARPVDATTYYYYYDDYYYDDYYDDDYYYYYYYYYYY